MNISKKIGYSSQLIEQDDIDAVIETLKGDFLTQGPKVDEFENAICEYVGIKGCVVFNSATSALFATYKASGIELDDEIITTPISFVATSNMFVMLGAKPIWCDVKDDGNIDESKIEELITDKTKAIVAVDFGGKPLEHTKIKNLAKKYNLLYIDDASHALGSSIDGKRVGTFADMSIFSFHAIKPITTGEGGAVVSDDEEFIERLKLIRSHGVVKMDLWRSDMVKMGCNLRMNDISASLGISQLKKLDGFIQQRDKIAKYYDDVFTNQNYFTTQKIEQNMLSSRHLYPIFLNEQLIPLKEKIFAQMHEAALGVQVHYRPIYQNSFYVKNFGKYKLENAERFYNSEISIPCHQGMSLDDAIYVASKVLEICKRLSSC